MGADAEALADIAFEARVIYWRGPAPFYFVAVPSEHVGELRYAARQASYGWGVVPVDASAAGVDFSTSLFPKDGGYLLPLKAAVRRAGKIEPDASVRVRIRVNRQPPAF
jgi:hypothetical protein